MMDKHWYSPSLTVFSALLLPFSYLFQAAVFCRRLLFRLKLKKTHYFPVPVIVVGNITVGGTGKTPFVIWLAQTLQQAGFKPGIVSRGIGGVKHITPYWVDAGADPFYVGDEACLLAQRTRCPLVVCVNRVLAVQCLLDKADCNVVISDDGLQHYRLGRDIEIAMIDRKRQLGNRHYLPAGPLRESAKRLQQVDFIVQDMRLQGDTLVSVAHPERRVKAAEFQGQLVHAVAGIGHPQRFFQELREKGYDLIEHVFIDHHRFQARDFDFGDKRPIIMTEKDAVKCKTWADERYWYLPVDAMVDESLKKLILERLCLSLKP